MFFIFLLGFPFTKEVLSYNLYFGPLRAGELKLSLVDGTLEGESIYYLTGVLKSQFLFRIDDSLFAIARRRDFTTLYSYKKVEEGGYFKESCYRFRGDRIEYSDGNSFDTEKSPKDLLSLWYYFRLFLPESAEETFAHFDKRNYLVRIMPRERVKVRTPMGSFFARRLKPKTFPKSVVGDVYISEDSLRLPLVIKTRLLLGLVKAELKGRAE